jgi:hypothetical protein
MQDDNNGPESGEKFVFTGGEDTGELVSARQNLAAALFLGAVAILAMVLALTMENTGGSIYSAAGLLPFLVGFSLFGMAVGLGAMAVRDGGAKDFLQGFGGLGGYFHDIERRRTILLVAIVTAYVALVDQVAFEWRLPIGGFDLRFSGYELFSIAALTLILRIFWRKPIPHCLGVSAGMVLALAAVFRYGFRILLPGLG